MSFKGMNKLILFLGPCPPFPPQYQSYFMQSMILRCSFLSLFIGPISLNQYIFPSAGCWVFFGRGYTLFSEFFIIWVLQEFEKINFHAFYHLSSDLSWLFWPLFQNLDCSWFYRHHLKVSTNNLLSQMGAAWKSTTFPKAEDSVCTQPFSPETLLS